MSKFLNADGMVPQEYTALDNSHRLLNGIPREDQLRRLWCRVIGPVGERVQRRAHDGIPTADPGVTGDAGESAGSRKASTASKIDVTETKLSVIVCSTWSLIVGSTCRCVWW